ncbi:MAG TPA: aminoglycoside adenylyltransferase domain-containing protein [Actinomycetota bacterium]|nr:aminoglycoside adenylyltransferase domain-containing protein [Actinomycetota bacterium]
MGVYLSGSLALGDFDRASSDLDVLVATAGPLGDADLERLRRLHADLTSAGSWTARLECVYLPLAALRRYDPADRRRYPVGAGDRGFVLGRQGPTWVFDRQVAREHGLVLLGPDPRTLIDPVAPQELQTTARAHLLDFWAGQLQNGTGPTGPAWLRGRNYQAFAILSLCRALYTLQHGEVVSKPAAAAWASRRLGPPWPSLVARALAWRSDERPDDAGLADTLRLVADAVARARAAG